MNNFFKLKENKTNVSTEIYAGLTTFMTMAYILIVNPRILSGAGMDYGAVFTATAVSAFVGTMAMALLANYPFALAPGMGLNAYFAFVVAKDYGWEVALLAVFVEGIVFILLSLINIREAIFDAIPKNLKYAVSVGIGLFIAFIGLINSGIVVQNVDTTVSLGNVKNVSTYLAMIGTLITVVFVVKKIKGALFWGIIATYLLGLLAQLVGIYVPDNITSFSLIPNSFISLPPSIGEYNLISVALSGKFNAIGIVDFLVVVFAFLFVDIFDTIGTLIGVSSKAGFLDKDGKLPRVKEALLADAIGTTIGALLGTSTVTTFVESAAGVSEGGRTGLTSVVTACLFLVSLIFFPIFSVIPSFATAPALIVVGLFMVEAVTKIDFAEPSEGFPAFITIIMMPFTYSISEGLVFGVLSYIIIKALSGKVKELNLVIVIIGILFAIKLFV